MSVLCRVFRRRPRPHLRRRQAQVSRGSVANRLGMKRLQEHEDIIQLFTALLVAALVAWRHITAGDSWLLWLPLSFLAFLGVLALWVLVWFLRRKFTYQRHAAANKAHLQSGGDGWPRHGDDDV